MCTKHVILTLCLLVTLTGTQAAPAQDSAKIDSSIPKEAAEAIEAGNWEKVVTVLKPLAAEKETSEPVQYWYGVAQFHREEYSRLCIDALKKALKANPKSKITAQYLARAGSKMTDRKEAIKTIQPVLEAFGNDPVILRAMGKAQARLYLSTYWSYRDVTEPGIYLEKAREYLEKAIAINPSDYQAHIDLVEVLDLTQDSATAIKHILIADRLEPLGHEAYVMLGQMYSEMGEHSRAADALKIAIELAPAKVKEVELDLGMELLEAKRSGEAVEVFRNIFKRNNMSRKVRFLLGRAAYEDGDYPLALFGFREAYKIDQNLEGLVWSARCAYDLGQDELAVKLVNRAIKEGKERAGEGKEFRIDRLWHFVRGRALWQMGDKKAAINDLEEAARRDPSNEEYARWAIYGFRQLNDPFGVVRVAKQYGLKGHAREALDVIRQLEQMWTMTPPQKDHRGKEYRGGITRQTMIAIAELYDELNLSKAAAVMCYMSGYNSRASVNSWASWLMYRGGNSPEAERMFNVLAKGRTDSYKQQGFKGLAFMALLRRDGEAARKNAEAITVDYYKPMVTTTLKWADVFSDKAEAVKKLDKFDMLGIYGTSLDGWKFKCGLAILGFIPGSPLKKAEPPVRPRDVVVRVGKRYLNCWASVENLRKEEIPEGKTPVVIRRGDKMFEVYVDFSAVRKQLAEEMSNKKETTQ